MCFTLYLRPSQFLHASHRRLYALVCLVVEPLSFFIAYFFGAPRGSKSFILEDLAGRAPPIGHQVAHFLQVPRNRVRVTTLWQHEAKQKAQGSNHTLAGRESEKWYRRLCLAFETMLSIHTHERFSKS